MARCPYCLGPNPAGSTICYTCGRVVAGSSGMNVRVGVAPHGGELVQNVRRGPAPNMTIRRDGRRRRKRNSNFRNMVLVVAVAFLFLFTPAQQQISNQLEKLMGELEDLLGPARIYPVAANYQVERTVELSNPTGASINFAYELYIPPSVRTDFAFETEGFIQDDFQHPTESLQSISSMTIRSEYNDTICCISSDTVDLPLDNSGWPLLADDAIDLINSRIYWPPVGTGSDRCSVSKCAIWEGEIGSSHTQFLKVTYSVTSYSFTWWDGEEAPDEAGRSNTGIAINHDNAGVYGDYQDSSRGHLNTMFDQIGDVSQWYDRDPGPNANWAIDGEHPIVVQLADEIESSLNEENKNSPYAFAHAAFTKIRDSIVYELDTDGGTARSGPQCISDQRGDCDEQSNAWMSLLRTRGIPAWYEFGPMTDTYFGDWEGHAWANVIFPLDESWCITNNIDISTCFVEGEVDVVNNRWLLHTPTTLTEWIEEPSYKGEAAYDFYRPLSIPCNPCWLESWETIDYTHMGQGTFKVRG
ncbi:MAG: transglutaminase-like domain-containing protein [Candidatus Thermoplasmatota archaeon]|nr:transglutaminase-like domain-containing protein [Candidatus Thermoplasmatota archaeon]